MRYLPLLFAFFLFACHSDNPPVVLNHGDAAPAFQTLRADGVPVRFPHNWAGKPVIIRFWADWCPYCAPEMKVIDTVYQRLKPQGLNIIAINTGQDKNTVLAFMTKLHVSYPSLLDEESTIARQYGVVGLPTTFFIDARGVLRVKLVGETDEVGFERAARQILE